MLCNAAIIHSLVFTAYLVLLGNIRFLSKSAAPSISPSISRSAASSETRTTAAKARTGPPFSCSFPATENVQRIRLQSEKRQKDQSNEEYDQTIHCGLHFLRKRHERTAGRLPTRVKWLVCFRVSALKMNQVEMLLCRWFTKNNNVCG